MRFRRLISLGLTLMALMLMVTTSGAQDRKIVTLIFTQELDTLNPMYTGMWFAGITSSLYLQGAIDFDDQLNPHPVLVSEVPSVENGGINADGTVITYRLRDGLTWSDGAALTSADFLFTYEMINSPANTPASTYPYTSDIIASVEAPDDQTVVVTFVTPFAPWLATIFTYILPEHILRPVFEADGTIDNAEWNRAPMVGVGPFVFQEWEPGSHILFARNEAYYGEAAKLDGLFIRFVEDDASQVAALISGDGDIGTFIANSDLPQLEAAGIVPQIVSSGYNEAWYFNVDPETAHPAMLDVNVRRALQLAFNRQEIVDTLQEGRTYVPATFWEGTAYAHPELEPPAYDPTLAAQLLDEAGWVDSDGDGIRDKDGVALSLRYVTTTRQIRVDTQVIAQQDLAEIGVELVLVNHSSDIFFSSFGEGGPVALGEYDIAEMSTASSFPDPNTSRFLCAEIPSSDNPTGGNDTHYCNPELDALFAQQAATVDFEARRAIFYQIAEMMNEAAIWTGVWYDPDVWVVNSRVQNVKLNGAFPFWNAAEWDV